MDTKVLISYSFSPFLQRPSCSLAVGALELVPSVLVSGAGQGLPPAPDVGGVEGLSLLPGPHHLGGPDLPPGHRLLGALPQLPHPRHQTGRMATEKRAEKNLRCWPSTWPMWIIIIFYNIIINLLTWIRGGGEKRLFKKCQ